MLEDNQNTKTMYCNIQVHCTSPEPLNIFITNCNNTNMIGIIDALLFWCREHATFLKSLLNVNLLGQGKAKENKTYNFSFSNPLHFAHWASDLPAELPGQLICWGLKPTTTQCNTSQKPTLNKCALVQYTYSHYAWISNCSTMRGHIKGAARANIANDHATLIFLQLEDTELFWIFTQEQQVAEANLQLVLHLHYL